MARILKATSLSMEVFLKSSSVTNYIVRVYYRYAKDPDKIIGVVEEVGVPHGTRNFHTVDEMASIIQGRDYKIASASGGGRRREGRLKLRLPVMIKGTNVSGARFTEETVLEDLSSFGAYFFMKNAVKPESRLRLLIEPENSRLDFRAKAARVAFGPGGSTGVGVFFDNKAPG